MKNPVRLINQQEDHNKYYNMDDNGNGTWTASYGRIGRSKVTYTYKMSDWSKKYTEKTRRKGYSDVSSNFISLGTVVRTPENREAIVISLSELGDMQVNVEHENGIKARYYSNNLSHAYVDPKFLLHKMMYPHLCQLYIEINGGDNEDKKSVKEVYHTLAGDK